jgi:hypothetical protein
MPACLPACRRGRVRGVRIVSHWPACAFTGNPQVARRYEVLKLQLAARHHGRDLASRERYSLGKTAFVGEVLRLAEVEGTGPASSPVDR